MRQGKNLRKYEPIKGYRWRKAVDYSSKIVKVAAIFSGQWPHSSYSVVGGVTCDPTTFEITEAEAIVDSLIYFTEEDIIGMDMEKYLSVSSLEEYLENSRECDLKAFLRLCLKHGLHKTGRSYHRFLTICQIEDVFEKGITKRKKKDFKPEKIKEIDTFSYLTEKGIKYDKERYSWAKAVRYEGLPYETSPLARRINSKDNLFLNLLKQFKDSYMVRTWARVDEIIRLLIAMKKRLRSIDLSEPFYIKPPVDHREISGEGTGLCEAARGSLIHRIKAENGKIKQYNIITPSTWNLGPRCEKYHSPAEKAIIGADSSLKAEMILRSFDVCSVCTTH
ncbi:nickel-dependent hydrogenase large subunit [Persephonella sp.]